MLRFFWHRSFSGIPWVFHYIFYDFSSIQSLLSLTRSLFQAFAIWNYFVEKIVAILLEFCEKKLLMKNKSPWARSYTLHLCNYAFYLKIIIEVFESNLIHFIYSIDNSWAGFHISACFKVQFSIFFEFWISWVDSEFLNCSSKLELGPFCKKFPY